MIGTGGEMMDKKDCCCSERHKDRSEEEKKKLMNRLKRIEGQIRGIEGIRCLLS